MSSLRWRYNRFKAYIGRPRLLLQEKVVVLDEGDLCESPLFIVGAHRSGTSLVRRMFNSHPDIACPPESFFIEYYAQMFANDQVRGGYEGLGYDEEHFRRDLMRKASSLHEAFRVGQGKAIWADKTPEYVRCLDAIDALFGNVPRYLAVYRHPWDIVHSVWKRGWRFNDIADGFESSLVYVRDAIAKLRKFEAEHPERCTRVVYRQLCEDPEATLSAAMAHIGLKYHPDMLEFASKNHNWGLEDPVIRGKRTVDFSADAWKSWSRADQTRALSILDPAEYQDLF